MRWAPILCAAALVSLPAPSVSDQPAGADNPLLEEWTTPFGLPPFERIQPSHFLPAFRHAIQRHDAEIAAIKADKAAPSFANTIERLDASGLVLARVNAVFSNLTSAETNDSLQAIARITAPMLTSHQDDVLLDPALFARVEKVWQGKARLEGRPDQAMLLERTWKNFVRGGARLPAEGKQRLRAINTELASLSVQFGDHLLKETNGFKLVLDRKEQLAGLPDRLVQGAAEAAKKAGLEGKWVFTLHAPSLWPFLQYADDRELRRQIFTAYVTRGDHGDDADNKRIVARIAALRAEKAKLLGYASHADFVLDENMAKTPARVRELLDRLWTPARAVAAEEAKALQEAIRADGKDFTLEPWDWSYYAEKVRQTKFALDEAAVRPYFPLDRVREGVFWTANKLYGLSFTPLSGVPVYHSEVRAWEVKDADGKHLAVFYGDYHPRPGKRTGAWNSRYRETFVRDGKSVRPIVVNVCNFSRPTGDAPALLSLGEAETMFHEFGHALHSILSQVRYRGVSGVPRDFVELPSQIMENWATQPEVLQVYARHWKTGEVIPDSLVRKIKEARKFNQGFETVEYLAASKLDLDWHTIGAGREEDAAAFEAASLKQMGMPPQIVPRYRSPYFQHIFSGGYSAGYYSYIWAEVLDADAFEAFREKGLFDPSTAKAFRTSILEKGGSEEAMKMYVRFRGREPSVDPLLERRGLKR